jgi:threonine 3-dehydrogenase
MMHIDDCLRSVIEFMDRPSESLPLRTYNVAGVSFTPEELAREIRRVVPKFDISYRPDSRQAIADSWPQVFDDSCAQRDWGWGPKYDLQGICDSMMRDLRPLYHPRGSSQSYEINEMQEEKSAATAVA